MKDRPPRQHSQALRSPLNNPHYERFIRRPPFYRDTTCLRRWAQRATPPLLYPPGKRETAYLYGCFSSVNLRQPDDSKFGKTLQFR
ncbi:hypothetical protein AVEN_93804-1 [Araneus ventricosus]|uniref:Uncharacterized protein n=1 Tax=Araneus ventricosus TaxID=182803 RepID=A0A4Y2AXH5_ARAVE|nr:hypothetical protein AVEN_93804-1 [Araneus ventricosus]